MPFGRRVFCPHTTHSYSVGRAIGGDSCRSLALFHASSASGPVRCSGPVAPHAGHHTDTGNPIRSAGCGAVQPQNGHGSTEPAA